MKNLEKDKDNKNKNKSQIISSNLNKKVLQILEEKEFQKLKLQYLFYKCFIISSDKINELLKEAKKKDTKNKDLDKIKVYYTPDYLYKINPKNKWRSINFTKKILFLERAYILSIIHF